MRRKTVRRREKKPKIPEPLVEVPLNVRRHRDWQSLSDEKLVFYAQKVVDKGLKNRSALDKKDTGLYQTLKKRKLLDRVEFAERKKVERNWKTMSDKELLDYAQDFMDNKKIKSRNGLQKEDRGLYQSLYKRKLLDRVEFGKKQRKWRLMTDQELVSCAQIVVDENGITNRGKLQEKDCGLYEILRGRKLLDRIRFLTKRETRNWKSWTDEKLIAHAQKVVGVGMKNRRELKKKDGGLYGILMRRGLLDKVAFEEKRKEGRNWKAFGDDEIVAYAQGFISEMRIMNQKGLIRKDKGLYSVLKRRKLIDKVEFEERRKLRKWRSIGDDEIVAYAQGFISEMRIMNRNELKKKDMGLVAVLRKRKLLDQVFAPIEQANKRRALDEIVEAVRKF